MNSNQSTEMEGVKISNSALQQRSAPFQLTFQVIIQKLKNPRKLLLSRVLEMYPGRESNPHGRNNHRILSPACLPVPPPGQKQCQ